MIDDAALKIWLGKCAVEIDVALTRRKKAVLNPRRVDLIAEIERTHSISAAARGLGISYRHAWLLVQVVNSAAGRTLVEAGVGGKRGGGAWLTDAGRAALRLFDDVQTSIRAAAADALPRALDVASENAPCVRLLAAVSLQDAVGELLAEFTLLRPEVRVRAVFGSSNELAEHVLRGSPADLFLTADEACLAPLTARGWIARGARKALGANGLALVVRENLPDVPAALRGWKSWNGGPTALADPASPLGGYTKTWLESVGVYEALAAQRVPADNSRAVVSVLQSGRADVGVVFASEVRRLAGFRTVASCAADQVSMRYVAAVLDRGERRSDAAALLKFLTGPAARSLLRRAGIEPAAK